MALTSGAANYLSEYPEVMGSAIGACGGGAVLMPLGGRGIDGPLSQPNGITNYFGTYNNYTSILPNTTAGASATSLFQGITPYVGGIVAATTLTTGADTDSRLAAYVAGPGLGASNASTNYVYSSSVTGNVNPSTKTQITGISTTMPGTLSVGQVISNALFTAGTYITAIDSTNKIITLSTTALGVTSSANSFSFCPYLTMSTPPTTAITTPTTFALCPLSYSRTVDMAVASVSAFNAATATSATITMRNGIYTDFYVGDYVLVINQQGDATNSGNVGNYEVAQVSAITSTTLTFTRALVRNYGSTTNAAIGNQKVNIYRIPEYTSAYTINSGNSYAPTPWNGTWGGVLVVAAQDLLDNGTFSVSGAGYRGGGTAGYPGEGQLGYPSAASASANGIGGAGGTSSFLAKSGTSLSTDTLPSLFMGGGGGASSSGNAGMPGGGILAIFAGRFGQYAAGSRGTNATLGTATASYNGAGAAGSILVVCDTLRVLQSQWQAPFIGGTIAYSTTDNAGANGKMRVSAYTIADELSSASADGVGKYTNTFAQPIYKHSL